MTPIENLTEAWTTPIDFQLLLNGVPFDASGMTVASILRDKEGQPVTVTTDWSAPAQSQVRIRPDGTTFVAANAPYNIRFRVVDGIGKVSYFPQGDAPKIAVARA